MRGWEPREFTEYEYEGDRLVRSVTYKEPEFSRGDVASAIAEQIRAADIGPHGIPMSEAMNPENQFGFKVSEKPEMDWAAAAIGKAQDAYYAGRGKDQPRHGHVWRAEPKASVAQPPQVGGD